MNGEKSQSEPQPRDPTGNATTSPMSSNSPSRSKRKITLETIGLVNNGSHTDVILDSPRSIEACKRAGVDHKKDLKIKTFSNFLLELGYKGSPSLGVPLQKQKQVSSPRRMTSASISRSGSTASGAPSHSAGGVVTAGESLLNVDDDIKVIAYSRFEHHRRRWEETVSMLKHIRTQIIDEEEAEARCRSESAKKSPLPASPRGDDKRSPSQPVASPFAMRERELGDNARDRVAYIKWFEKEQALQKQEGIEERTQRAEARRLEALEQKRFAVANKSRNSRSSSAGASLRDAQSLPSDARAQAVRERAEAIKAHQRHEVATKIKKMQEQNEAFESKRQASAVTTAQSKAAKQDELKRRIELAKQRREAMENLQREKALQRVHRTDTKAEKCANKLKNLHVDAAECADYNADRMDEVRERRQAIAEYEAQKQEEKLRRLEANEYIQDSRRQQRLEEDAMKREEKAMLYRERQEHAKAVSNAVEEYQRSKAIQEQDIKESQHFVAQRHQQRARKMNLELKRQAEEDRQLNAMRSRRALEHMEEQRRKKRSV